MQRTIVINVEIPDELITEVGISYWDRKVNAWESDLQVRLAQLRTIDPHYVDYMKRIMTRTIDEALRKKMN